MISGTPIASFIFAYGHVIQLNQKGGIKNQKVDIYDISCHQLIWVSFVIAKGIASCYFVI